MKRARGILLTILVTLLSFSTQAFQDQEPDSTEIPEDWFLKDPETDNVQGVSAEKAYTILLTGKPSRTVVVAVIDSGVDIDHEDLRDVIWVNEDEVAGNGVDDDRNGYADDLHGWNFLGGKNGNVKEDTYEVTREYARLKTRYETVDEKNVSKKDQAEYDYWKKVKTKYERDSNFSREQYEQFNQQYELYANIYGTISYYDSILQKATGGPVTKSSLAGVNATNDTLRMAKDMLTKILENVQAEEVEVSELLVELEYALGQLTEAVHHYKTAVEYGYNTEFDSRKIVGDNPDDLYEKGYGNNDVKGPDPSHGTHVAGIIAANRKNGIGVKGIADNVRIMSLRAVPNGDERDKDVANAIRYAVDNGAHIINMSFGKKFSPGKDAVDQAIKYAESKGVLMVHGAGNDGDDVDIEDNFPTREYGKGGVAKTWLEIGASSWGADQDFVASFSNYGKKSVDLFAPGVKIYSTTPGNSYEEQQGTSMASPAAAGVAAIIMSYFPELTAVQVRDVLRMSARKFGELKVTKPGSQDAVPFQELSSAGGLVNAYEAVKAAMALKGKSAAR